MTEGSRRPALLTEEQAAKTLGMTARFLQARRNRGGGPPYIRVSARAIRYRATDLETWIESRRCRSTSEYRLQPGEPT